MIAVFMVQTASKWFARIFVGLSALLCLCFLPLSFFVGGMSVGVGPGIPFLSVVIIFFPALVAALLIVALVWLECHPRYFRHGAIAIAVGGALLVIWLPRSAFLYVADYFVPPTPEQARTLKWARRYVPAGPAVVDFTIDAARFGVPRAYLLGMNNWRGGPQYAVSLIAHIPDMRPFDQTADNCVLTNGLSYRTNPCGVFKFLLGSGTARSPDDLFAAAHLQNQTPIAGPFGFEEYDIRENTAFFRKVVDGQTYFYRCDTVKSAAGRTGGCTSFGESAAPAGGSFSFLFDFDELGNIVQIDSALRHLVDSFIVK